MVEVFFLSLCLTAENIELANVQSKYEIKVGGLSLVLLNKTDFWDVSDVLKGSKT